MIVIMIVVAMDCCMQNTAYMVLGSVQVMSEVATKVYLHSLLFCPGFIKFSARCIETKTHDILTIYPVVVFVFFFHLVTNRMVVFQICSCKADFLFCWLEF
jgi:hypothetical protein